MTEILPSTEIDAPPERVWEILTDFEKYHEWNSFTVTAEGPFEVGSVIKLLVAFPNGQRLTTTHTIDSIRPPYEMCWRKLNFPLLLWSRRCQVIEPLDGERSRYLNREYFFGPLAPVANYFYGRQVHRGLDEMAAALKQRAEERNNRGS